MRIVRSKEFKRLGASRLMTQAHAASESTVSVFIYMSHDGRSQIEENCIYEMRIRLCKLEMCHPRFVCVKTGKGYVMCRYLSITCAHVIYSRT